MHSFDTGLQPDASRCATLVKNDWYTPTLSDAKAGYKLISRLFTCLALNEYKTKSSINAVALVELTIFKQLNSEVEKLLTAAFHNKSPAHSLVL